MNQSASCQIGCTRGKLVFKRLRWSNCNRHGPRIASAPGRLSRNDVYGFRWARVSTGCISRRSFLSSGATIVACGDGARVQASSDTVVDTETQSLEQNETLAPSPPTYVTASGRIVAIGDLHGDLSKTLRSLELAGVMKEDEEGSPVWCGGNTTVVQLGDVLDRGDCEIGILMLLRDLGRQAEQEGGGVYMLNGNHESLNVCGNFRYVTRGAFYESALAAGVSGEAARTWEEQLMSRIALFSPGGLVANELAKNPTVLVVNDTVFAHGGLLPVHVTYGLEKINREMAAWMRGDVLPDGTKATPPYIAMGGSNSILWNRTLAQETFTTPYDRYYACSLLKSALEKIGGKRLVVGHTPQLHGCNCECGGQVWRIDVGMSQGVLNAGPQVLEISQNEDGCTKVEPIAPNDGIFSSRLRVNGRARGMTASQDGASASVFNFEWISKRITVNVQRADDV